MKMIMDADMNKERLCIGLMSGTSADGVDAALCRITGYGINTRIELVHLSSHPYPDNIRKALTERIITLSIEECARLNFLIAEILSQAALQCISEANLKPKDITFISSHGQTMAHYPDNNHQEFPIGATLQIGDLSLIAQRTGILTVGDFRPADMAQGGQGAPLVPFADHVLFTHPEKGRIIQNIGGIGNLSYLKPGAHIDDVLAFDTGPGNMLIDLLIRLVTDGRETMDKDANLAFQGRINQELLNRLLGHTYFKKPPPKSTGREEFGLEFLKPFMDQYPLSPPDMAATLSEFTVETIVGAYRKWVFPAGPVHQLIIGGGGANNPYFMKRFKDLLYPVEVLTHDDLGIPSKAKEALAFAILGNQLLAGYPNNVPAATGAVKPVVMGKIALS